MNQFAFVVYKVTKMVENSIQIHLLTQFLALKNKNKMYVGDPEKKFVWINPRFTRVRKTRVLDNK